MAVFIYSVIQMSQFLVPALEKPIRLPLFSSLIRAGFPSPAEDHIEQTLDITELIVKNPSSTFYLRVAGESMVNAGIFERDILVVDRSLTAKHGDIIVAEVNSEFTVKRFYCRGGRIVLHAESDKHESLTIKESDDFSIFGKVTSVVRQL